MNILREPPWLLVVRGDHVNVWDGADYRAVKRGDVIRVGSSYDQLERKYRKSIEKGYLEIKLSSEVEDE